MKIILQLKLTAAVITLAVMATACGGGGSSSSGAAVVASPDQPDIIDPPPAPDEPAEPPVARRDAFACGSGGATVNADQSAGSYVLFESAPVRPLAWSEDGSRLLVTNTPANCLEIYAVEADQFRLEATVMVGMEPVAVAFADAGEAWVVNHLSDSVSVVDLTGVPRVVQTLQVGDEPRDIVFAGPDRARAFITAAYRGQNHPTFQPVAPDVALPSEFEGDDESLSWTISTRWQPTEQHDLDSVEPGWRHRLRCGLPLRERDDHPARGCREERQATAD